MMAIPHELDSPSVRSFPQALANAGSSSLGATVRLSGGWQVISQGACDLPSGAMYIVTRRSDIAMTARNHLAVFGLVLDDR